MAGKELTLDEMKAIELGILKKFDSICKENGLEYSLAYGTMLGAIRHKGFIPWDDDIDVFMKREDYEKLLALKYDDGDFEVKSYRYSKNYYFLYSKIVDKRTSICENWRAEKDMGLFVDIFPLDYCNFDGEGDKLKAQMELISCIQKTKAVTIWLKILNATPSIIRIYFQSSRYAALKTLNSRYIRNTTKFSPNSTEII